MGFYQRREGQEDAENQRDEERTSAGDRSSLKTLEKKVQFAVLLQRRLPLRECREMRGDLFTSFICSGRAGNCIGGRNCHRKHVEDG
ncbi:unnamed protein product [Citrullus colocynthis]|uniref:C3H1-type domain-containing protein n=1 Tax=Citrullus colocynthis TaxID=252529 RepID=A0ABP0ZAD9_9ROSI